MEIIVGTANWSNDYWGKNLNLETCLEIKDSMIKHGINTLDTSPYYGQAEKIILDHFQDFKVISKYSNVKHTTIQKQYCRMLHHFSDFYKYHSLVEIYKSAGICEKVGVSIYKVSEIDLLLESNAQIDIVQFPINLDFRDFNKFFYDSKNKKFKLHARSIFGRGHLPIKDSIQFIKQYEGIIDAIVVGVDNAQQLDEIVELMK